MSANCVNKYRIYPTKAQARQLDATLETCRLVYNSFVHWRTFEYDITGKSVGRYEQEAALTHWKKDHPELSVAHAHLLQNVAHRVDLAFRAFFRRVKAGETPGYPRLKGKGQYDSVCFKQWGNGVQFKNGNLWLSKIGELKCKVHRPLLGEAKTCCLRHVNGKWFACVTCELEPSALPVSEESIGIDVGLKTFAALSDGTFIENPGFFRTEENALAKAGRKQAKTKKRSRERRKVNKVLSRIHERVRNRRHDFAHQTARRLVNQYGVIAVEKLNVKNMSKAPAPKPDAENEGQFLPSGASQKACLNKSILDAAWSQFRSILTNKAESAGRGCKPCVYESEVFWLRLPSLQDTERALALVPDVRGESRQGHERRHQHSTTRPGITWRGMKEAQEAPRL